MKNKINSIKVVEEIDDIIKAVRDRVSKAEDFEDLHKRALMVCKLIFTSKKDYKSIDESYPIHVVIVFDSAFGGREKEGDEKESIEIPNKELRVKIRQEFAEKILNVLNGAREFYTLKLKLESSS